MTEPSGSRPPSLKPRDLVIAGLFILAGSIPPTLLSSLLWSVLGIAGAGAYLAGAARRNWRGGPTPPGRTAQPPAP